MISETREVEPKMEKTIHTQLLKEHLKIIIISGFIKKRHPLSTLIIAWNEHAKSEETLKLKNINILVISDVTAWGLQKILTERKIRYHHIIIPEFEKLNARGQKVKAEVLAVFKIMMRQGIGKVRTKYLRFDLASRPYQAGIILCVTPDDMHPISTLHKLSFLNCLIPFSYEYSNDEKEDILGYIVSEEQELKELQKIASIKNVDITIPEKFKADLISKAKTLAERMNNYCASWKKIEEETTDENGVTHIRRKYEKVVQQKIFGSRALIYYITYLKSIALKNHSDDLIVKDSDWQEFCELEQYFNFDMRELK
jgi:hypothetical protein